MRAQIISAIIILIATTAQASTLRFSQIEYGVMETGETMTITVTRTGDSNGMASVSYTTESTDNTATSGIDYTPKTGNLNWNNGDSSPKTFTISILDDTTEEENEIIYLNLKNATGAALGLPTTVPLTIVDEDTVPDLFKVGHWGSGHYYEVVVAGNYAYVAAGRTGLEIFDISDPANPVMVGRCDTSENAYDVALDGNYAYVADSWEGLQIIDISNPANPVAVGHYGTSGSAYGVALSGNYAYVADSSSGLQIIDISNPANPVAVGHYDTSGSAKGVALSGNYAYVADNNEGLQIIDISNPANPVAVGHYDTEGWAKDVALSGNYAYVADHWNGLQIIDISNPANPVAVGLYDTEGNALGVTLSGNYAYVAASSGGLQIIDISNPANPVAVGHYDTSGSAKGVALSGNYAYVADNGDGLQIIDISNPANPVAVVLYDTLGSSQGIALDGNYAYVADWNSGLQIIDISNPANPVAVGHYNTSGHARGVALSGNYAYVADSEDGLQIIDISNPANPVAVGHYDTEEYALGVALSGNYAYVADHWNGLQIIDISNPANPVAVGHYDTEGYARGVALSGNYAYVADGYWGGLQIVDISDPANPVAVGHYDTSGDAKGVALSGNYAYVADGSKGLQIIDISDPANPWLRGYYDTSGDAKGVALSGNYIYVADGDNRLEIFRFNPPQPGSLQFSAASFTVKENDTSLEISVTRTAGSKGAVSVQYRITGGTATVGTDYAITPDTLNWADGDTEAKNFTVNPVNDSDQEGDETFTIELYNPENATIGSPNSATVTIKDDDVTSNHGTLQLSAATETVAENAGTVTITVTRTDGSDGNISVDYATSDDTAIAGSDYLATSGTLDWTDGESADKTFDVDITDDSSEEDDETFIVSLGNPTGGAELGEPDTAVVTITDNDTTEKHGILQFSKTEFTVREDVHTAQAIITVKRIGGSDGVVLVEYATSDDTAKAGSDYTKTLGGVRWEDGDDDDKTFTVHIINDDESENDETFIVSLANPRGGAQIGSPDTATVTIKDDDKTFNCKKASGISTKECQALVALYDSTDGENWVDNGGWKTTKKPCNWNGVTCRNKHVTGLILRNNNLKGSISKKISKLKKLEILSLDDNKLSGKIPSSLTKLKKLTYLNLNDNCLKTKVSKKLKKWLDEINPGWDETQTNCLY